MKGWCGLLGLCCAFGLGLATYIPAADESAGEPDQPIAAVQALLGRERLYSGPVDGVLNEATVAGIRHYQILHGLRVSGALDTPTLRAMLAPPPPVSPEITASDRELLRELSEASLPEPVAERRIPIPPGEPVAVSQASPQKTSGRAGKKTNRPKAAKVRRSSGGWTHPGD